MKVWGELHPYQPAWIAGFRRAVLPAGIPNRRRSYPNKAGGPFPDFGVTRNNFYGFVNRDYQSIKQDIGTANVEVTISPELTVSNKTRLQRSVLDFIGTLPEAPITNLTANPLLWTVSANPQSRYQVTDVAANQSEAAFKFDTGPWKHNAVAGVEISRERFSLDKYAGLSSEALPGGFSGTGALTGVNIFSPQFTDLPFGGNPQLTGIPTDRHRRYQERTMSSTPPTTTTSCS